MNIFLIKLLQFVIDNYFDEGLTYICKKIFLKA